VAAVTKWRIFAVLAVAQPDFLLLSQSEFLGTKPGTFVVAITHRLMTAQTTGTPPVITGFEFECNRLGFKDFGEIFHDFFVWVFDEW
jgi:hypothetical protein